MDDTAHTWRLARDDVSRAAVLAEAHTAGMTERQLSAELGISRARASQLLAQTQHFCYEPPISRNQLIGKGFQRRHVF
jgi:hypothetical protein